MNQAISVNSEKEYISELIQRFGFSCTEHDAAMILHVPADLGEGYIKIDRVSEDITIGTMDLFLNVPLITYYENYANTCEITYCVSGHMAYSETGQPKVQLGTNEVGMYAIPRSRGMMLLPSEERIILVAIETGEEFHKMLPYMVQCRQFDDPKVRDLLYEMAMPTKARAKIHNLFRSILENNMHGSLQKNYLESASKMLLSEMWQENVVDKLSDVQETDRRKLDMPALLNARDILRQCYMNPPVVNELAHMVAMNEYSLKQGFRMAFGKSVYAYVRSVRMEHARDMLEDSSISIGQIAAMVGYTNASHFARAFRNEYGLNPKEFRFGS